MIERTGKIRRRLLLWLVWTMSLSVILAGCTSDAQTIGYNAPKARVAQKAIRFTGEESKAIPYVYTTGRDLSLTFNGMADRATMKRLLDELDKYHLKATFFLPGMRVAEEPELAREIASRGHEIENNTLNQLDLTKLPYEQIDSEIKLGKEVIQKKLGITTRYVRTKSGEFTDDIRLAASENGQSAVISSSLFLHNWQSESESQKIHYLRKYINRGGIIAMDTEENKQLLENIALLARLAEDVGYQFVPLQKLIESGGERKPLQEIAGFDAAKVNTDYRHATYRVFTKQETNKKQVALSFDDWGTDQTITKILDILDKYHVQATFFLRADGVEKNPNLARAIAEAGHDVANHSYSHPVVTKVSPEQLQQEIVKAHQIITEAIQEKPTMYFRPPTGVFDENTLRVIGATGYHTVTDFDVDPSDYLKTKTPDEIVQAILEQTQNGSVILLHLLDDIHTIEALPIVIEKLRSRGYTFVKMSEMFGP
ncbi:polysaccharide deacetylase family protein [Brevibacillus nitrificans]|uniref:Polysaccharide deacetylase family protein n=1 Tax=Brevibacillus nitrificans TaxID=651560 RepID=A0A3M8DJ22_9BACL|nr:polysaccharide deacetylase family protein [Brevibacillus nitrificans]RNB88036.1 polysaccharide deacetylase family protein [Brevibacillus nitrificans]